MGGGERGYLFSANAPTDQRCGEMTHSANRNNNEDVVAWFSGSSVMGTEEDAEDGTGWWLVADLAHLVGSL